MFDMDDYKRKIATIFYYRLHSCGDNNIDIESVHNWLECEFQYTDMLPPEKILLDSYIDEFAKEVLSNFK